jgi:adenylate kinase family enzyme
MQKLFQSQRAAAHKLFAHYKASFKVDSVAGFSVRPTALVLGPSGVGKSVVARCIATSAKVPLFETSLSAWTPTNSTATNNGKKSTIEEYVNFIERNSEVLLEKKKKLVVFVDEVDKLSQSATDNSNWCSFVWSEIMRMLDGRLNEFGIKRVLAKQAHLASYFIFAGAFQRLWDKETGVIGFVEQVEESRLEHDTLARAEILPKELLNRITGMTVNVRPPSVDEVRARLIEIEDNFFMKRDLKEVERDAKSIITSGHFVRGIEQHFTRLACDQFTPKEYKDLEIWGPSHPDDYEDDETSETLDEGCEP